MSYDKPNEYLDPTALGGRHAAKYTQINEEMRSNKANENIAQQRTNSSDYFNRNKLGLEANKLSLGTAAKPNVFGRIDPTNYWNSLGSNNYGGSSFGSNNFSSNNFGSNNYGNNYNTANSLGTSLW